MDARPCVYKQYKRLTIFRKTTRVRKRARARARIRDQRKKLKLKNIPKRHNATSTFTRDTSTSTRVLDAECAIAARAVETKAISRVN